MLCSLISSGDRTLARSLVVGVSRTLRDAQREILSFVDGETYLVGHSLDSDLKALRLVHRRLIDTSELYPNPRGIPFKARGLISPEAVVRWIGATPLPLTPLPPFTSIPV